MSEARRGLIPLQRRLALLGVERDRVERDLDVLRKELATAEAAAEDAGARRERDAQAYRSALDRYERDCTGGAIVEPQHLRLMAEEVRRSMDVLTQSREQETRVRDHLDRLRRKCEDARQRLSGFREAVEKASGAVRNERQRHRDRRVEELAVQRRGQG